MFDTYWRFAAERLETYYRRLSDNAGPWTSDPIIRSYRFTNSYRAADRVSQYLIRQVQYGEGRSQDPQELFLRTLIFKIFNKINTWEELERIHGPIEMRSFKVDLFDRSLTKMSEAGAIYSAAYIMPAPLLGEKRKHSNHLKLIKCMLEDRLPDRLKQAPTLRDVYEKILSYSGLGPFLAFQYAIDLNYSNLTDFSEDEFVVAGPGALDGISKCFETTGGLTPSQIIKWVTERQELEFGRRGIDFPGLYGRRLHLIDCQNLFCEISKYSRIAHPEIQGIANRKRIKQGYSSSPKRVVQPFFPPKWNLSVPEVTECVGRKEEQLDLL